MLYCYIIGITALFSLTMMIVFFSKKRIKNEQTIIFTRLLIYNFIGLIIENTEMIYLLLNYNTFNELLAQFMTKLYMVYTAVFVNELTLYIFSVCYEKDNNDYYKRIKLYSNLACAMIGIICLFLPTHTNDLYGYGTSVNFVTLYGIFNIIYWSIALVKNIRKFNLRTMIPILVIILICLVTGIIEAINPTIAILTVLEFVDMYLIYLTMENTDYKMIKDLENARNQAQEAYNNKNEFLKNMSHEIRTPLNGIIGLSEDIRAYGDEVPEGLLTTTNEIIYNSNLLLETVSSIIDINKLNSQIFNKIENKYNINSILEQVEKSVSDKIKANVKLNITVSEDIPTLYGDDNHIRQVITKVLENAVTTTKSGEIKLIIDTISQNDQIILRMMTKDTGIGIHEDVLPYIYNYNDEKIKKNKYYNVKVSLNFSVVKRLLDMLNGTISITSTYKEGTTVVIEIPQRIGKEVK